MKWVARILIGLAALVGVLVALVLGVLLWFHIPQNASGMAAITICDAVFVSGRTATADELMTSDVLPASPVLAAISAQVDSQEHTASARFLGLFPRTAALVGKRGCILDAPADPNAVPYTPAAVNPAPWPAGDAPMTAAQVAAAGVDQAALNRVLDAAFVGSGDPLAGNARGVAVVQGGRLIAQRDGAGIAPNTALHGWSMTKTVGAMLLWKKAKEVGLDFNTRVVDVFPEGRAPDWVADWKSDERAAITVADLMFMRAGLALNEGYGPTGDVVQMLYGETNMASWAASHPLEFTPGSTWEYLSADSNILAATTRGQFATDQEYTEYPYRALLDPIGARTTTMQTDYSGTWVASSYLWGSVGDWARLGHLMLHDGDWNGQQVFPKGWLAQAATPAVATGEGHGYGAQTWLPGEPNGGECATTPEFPADTLFMEGHWGQVVAMVPSRDAVIVRMGWTFDSTQFDSCTFVADVVKTLPAR